MHDFPDPVAGHTSVVIDIKYCGVNHLDIWTREGIAGKKISLPHICGCDIVGTVKSGPRGFKPGDRLMVYPGVSCGRCARCMEGRENLCSTFAIIGGFSDYDGGYAERIAVPEKNAIRLPDSITDKVAATLGVSYLTAWNMLKTNGAGKKKTILIYGAASGVGMATIQLAKALGATVLTTASGSAKLAFAKRIGADHAIDRDSQDVAEQAIKITGGTGVDIVVDHVGAATWQTSIAALRPGGRMAVCGMTSGNEATVPVRTFYTKQITMTGALMGSREQLLELVNFVSRKKIRPVIDSVVQLEEAAYAQRKMEAGLHMG
jgi:NADPH:quinone reductase-like Zn-dependent oxidoreductase